METVHVSNYLMTRQKDWIFYNSIHSYSQLVLLPWGYTNTLPDDYQTMFELAQRGADALHNVHGKTYEVRAPLVYFGDLVSSCDYIVPCSHCCKALPSSIAMASGGKSLFIHFCLFYCIRKFCDTLDVVSEDHRRQMSSAFDFIFDKFSNPITDRVNLTPPD